MNILRRLTLVAELERSDAVIEFYEQGDKRIALYYDRDGCTLLSSSAPNTVGGIEYKGTAYYFVMQSSRDDLAAIERYIENLFVRQSLEEFLREKSGKSKGKMR